MKLICVLMLMVSVSLEVLSAETKRYEPGVESGTTRAKVEPTGLTVYTDRGVFEGAVSLPLISEDFEAGAAGIGSIVGCSEPVNSASNDACFTPGDLIDGFSVVSGLGGGVVIIGPGFIGQDSVAIGADKFSDSTTVLFPGGNIQAVGFEVTSNVSGDVNVTVNGSQSVLGTTPVNVPKSGMMIFVGFASPEPIASIEVEGSGGSGEFIDDLIINGAPPASSPVVVPMFSWLGVVFLMVLLIWRAGRSMKN